MIKKPTSLAVIALLMGDSTKATKLTAQNSNYLYTDTDIE